MKGGLEAAVVQPEIASGGLEVANVLFRLRGASAGTQAATTSPTTQLASALWAEAYVDALLVSNDSKQQRP